jgi:hypothetical protein
VKFRWPLLFLCAFLFTSCVIEKRHYRNGFYVNWNNPDNSGSTSDTGEQNPPSLVAESSVTDEEIVVVPVQAAEQNTESVYTIPTSDHAGKVRDESPDRPVEQNEDPKPEGHDKINPVISPMVGVAFAMPFSLLVLELLGAFGSNPYVLLIGIPLIAALLFALAMNLRKKYVTLISLGDVRERLRLSAHFHRFQILLYIFFTAALMISFGFALTLSTSSILGWIGIILSGGGIVVGIGVGAVLLTLFAFYLIRWRKDPTGYKPPRNPHPPKDR